jgi:hypothetical protein
MKPIFCTPQKPRLPTKPPQKAATECRVTKKTPGQPEVVGNTLSPKQDEKLRMWKPQVN